MGGSQHEAHLPSQLTSPLESTGTLQQHALRTLPAYSIRLTPPLLDLPTRSLYTSTIQATSTIQTTGISLSFKYPRNPVGILTIRLTPHPLKRTRRNKRNATHLIPGTTGSARTAPQLVVGQLRVPADLECPQHHCPHPTLPTHIHWGQGVKYPAGTLRRHGVHRHKVITMCPPIKNRPHFE